MKPAPSSVQENLPIAFQLAISGFPLEYLFLLLTQLVKGVQLLTKTNQQTLSSNDSNELNVITLVTSKMQLDYPLGWIYMYTHTDIHTHMRCIHIQCKLENHLKS